MSTPAGDTNVELAIRWTEAGQNIPAKTTAALQGLKNAAGETAVTVGDRLSKAFSDVERREPTFAVRRLRFAMDELTASALGIAGPMGRVVATMGMMQFGGAIAAAGGLVVMIKEMVEFSGKLDKQLEGLNTKFATLGGTMAVTLRQIETMREMEVEQPSLALRLAGRLGTLGSSSLSPLGVLRPEESGEGDLNQAIQEGFAAQMATQSNARLLMDRHLTEVRQQRDQQATAKLLRHIGSEATPTALRDLVSRRDDIVKLGTETAQLWAKAFVDAVRREEDPRRQMTALLAQRSTFEKMGGEAWMSWRKAFLDAATAMPPMITPHRLMPTAEFLARTKPTQFGPALTPIQTFEGEAESMLRARHRPTIAPVTPPARFLGPAPTPAFGTTPPMFHAFGATFHPLTDRPEGNEKNEARIDAANARNAERMAVALGRELGPMIAAFSGGGARAAVAGIGGITGTLASMTDPRSGEAMLGKLAPQLGLVSGVLTGLSSLLGGGGQKPKVIITAFEDAALREMKQLRGEPLTTQIIVVGAVDMRQVQQQLSRLNRLGIIPRLP